LALRASGIMLRRIDEACCTKIFVDFPEELVLASAAVTQKRPGTLQWGSKSSGGDRMRTKVWMISLAAGFALLQMTSVQAAKVKPMSVKAENKADFEAVTAEVHKQMVPGGRFEFVTKEEAATVNNNLNEMQALFDKYGTVEQMDQSSKVQLYNDQESVNAILTRRDSDKLVCETAPPTGSLIPKKNCRTYGEIEKSQRDTQNFMNRFQQSAQPSGSSLNGGVGSGH
jgi:hypothetical protein